MEIEKMNKESVIHDFIEHCMMVEGKNIDSYIWDLNDVRNEAKKYLSQQKPQTKEDWWVNGLPPIGVECEFREGDPTSISCFSDWSKCKILAYNQPENSGELQIIIRDYNGDSAIIYSTEDPVFRKLEAEEEKMERECGGREMNKEVIAKLERILELTSTHGITLQPENKPATSDDQLMYVESKIRLNAIQALDIFDKNNIERQKPRTKTEFVKCEYGDKVSNIVMDFENNVPLYKLVNDEHWTIDELDDLFQIILNDCYIYRKVETEIDERQEFIDAYASLRHKFHGQRTYDDFSGFMFDSGEFKLVDGNG